MRKIKRPKIGEQVLATRWSDRDPMDPWALGCVKCIHEYQQGFTYTIEGSGREWKHVFRMSPADITSWFRLYGARKAKDPE